MTGLLVAAPVAFDRIGLHELAADLDTAALAGPARRGGLAFSVIYRFAPAGPTCAGAGSRWGGCSRPVSGWAAPWLFPVCRTTSPTSTPPTGSLGAVIGFMMWIWFSVMVVLIGAELNAEIEHQTARIPPPARAAHGRARRGHGRQRRPGLPPGHLEDQGPGRGRWPASGGEGRNILESVSRTVFQRRQLGGLILGDQRIDHVVEDSPSITLARL